MFNNDDINANKIEDMEKTDARELLAMLERTGGLFDYISENYPRYISPDGSVSKFSIATEFNLW